MAPILLAAGAVALAAIAAAASRSDKSAPQPSGGPSGSPLPLPGAGSLPIPSFPGFPDLSQIPMPQWPGASSPEPQAPPPAIPPPAPPAQQTIQPWAPGDIVRRDFGNNIGQLTPSGAIKLRERLVKGGLLGSVDKPWLLQFTSAAPWPVNSGLPRYSTLERFQANLYPFNAFELLLFKPFAPSLRFERIGGQDVEVQDFFLMASQRESVLDDPIDAVKGWFTGETPRAFPMSPEGFVVVTSAEAYNLGILQRPN